MQNKSIHGISQVWEVITVGQIQPFIQIGVINGNVRDRLIKENTHHSSLPIGIYKQEDIILKSRYAEPKDASDDKSKYIVVDSEVDVPSWCPFQNFVTLKPAVVLPKSKEDILRANQVQFAIAEGIREMNDTQWLECLKEPLFQGLLTAMEEYASVKVTSAIAPYKLRIAELEEMLQLADNTISSPQRNI